jgi:hypothetical protein
MQSIFQPSDARFFGFLRTIVWQFKGHGPAVLLVMFFFALCPTAMAQATDDPTLKMLTTLQQLYFDKPTLSTKEEQDEFCRVWIWLASEMKINSLSNDKQDLNDLSKCSWVLQLVEKSKLTPYSDPRFEWLRNQLENRVIAGIEALHLQLRDRPVVGTLPAGYLNAKVIRVRDAKRPLIILNDQVFRLPYDTSKAVIQAIDFQPGGQGATYAATDRKQINAYLDGHPEVIGNLEHSVLSYLHRVTSPPPDGPPALNTDLDLVKFQLYYRLVDAVEIFILAHEFAHVLLNHPPDRHLSLLMTGSKASSVTVDEISYSWRQEFEADAYGFFILEAVLQQTETGLSWKGDPFYPFLLSAPAFFFLSMQLVENGQAILETGKPLPPTSAEDLELVKLAIQDLFDQKKPPQSTDNEKRKLSTKTHPPFAFRFIQAQLLEEKAKAAFFKDHKLSPGTEQVHRFAQVFQDTLEILFEKVNSRMKQKFDEGNRTKAKP